MQHLQLNQLVEPKALFLSLKPFIADTLSPAWLIGIDHFDQIIVLLAAKNRMLADLISADLRLWRHDET